MSTPDRRGLLDRDHVRLSIRRQCALLDVGAIRRLPPADSGQRRRSRADAAYRRAVHRLAVPGLAPPGADPELGGAADQSQALAAAVGIAALGPRPRTTQPAQDTRFSRICCAVL
jgi:hypothetical protein